MVFVELKIKHSTKLHHIALFYDLITRDAKTVSDFGYYGIVLAYFKKSFAKNKNFCSFCYISSDFISGMEIHFAELFVNKRNIWVGWLVVGIEGRLSHGGLRPMNGMPSVGFFLREPSPYLREFRRKPRKTPNG